MEFKKVLTSLLKRFDEQEIWPEDIIRLKIQAMANNPGRRNRELADIEEIDWELVREYFQLFDFKEEFTRLKKGYYEAD